MKTPDKIKKGLECCIPRWVGNHWKSCSSKCRYITLAASCRGQLIYDALTLIQQLEAQIPKWISVEDEQKPKHGQEYFIRYAFGIKGDKYNSHGPFYGAAKWNSAGNNGYVDGPHFDNEGMNELFVTHWMEIPQLLPEPPKEETECECMQ